MKNAVASILLFLVIMGFVGYANNKLVDMCDQIIEYSQELEFLILRDEWEEAFTLSVQIMDIVRENDLITSVYLNHTETEHLTDEALRLNIFSETKTYDEALISVHNLKYSASNVKKLHELSLKNIF